MQSLYVIVKGHFGGMNESRLAANLDHGVAAGNPVRREHLVLSLLLSS